MNSESLNNLAAYLGDDLGQSQDALADLFAMSELVDNIQRKIRQLGDASGIPAQQFFVLERLGMHGGQAPLAALLAELQMPKQTGTYVIDQLEKAQLVERVRDPRDRRRLVVALTEAGAKHLKEHLGPFYQQMVHATEAMNPTDRSAVIAGLATFLLEL